MICNIIHPFFFSETTDVKKVTPARHISRNTDMCMSSNGTLCIHLFLVTQPQNPFSLPKNKILSSWALVTKQTQVSSTPAFQNSDNNKITIAIIIIINTMTIITGFPVNSLELLSVNLHFYLSKWVDDKMSKHLRGTMNLGSQYCHYGIKSFSNLNTCWLRTGLCTETLFLLVL